MLNLYISSINKLFANINNKKDELIVFAIHICHFYKAYVSCLSV